MHFGSNITIRDLFKHSKIEDLVKFISKSKSKILIDINEVLSKRLSNPRLSPEVIKKIKLKEFGGGVYAIYRTNSLQESFIAHSLHYPEDDAYIVQVLINYNCTLNIKLYIEAWDKVVEASPALRSSYNWEDQLIQIIHMVGKVDYEYIDISNEKCQKNIITKIEKKDRKKRFDLGRVSQFRLYILKINDSNYKILFSHHHIILDGTGVMLLLDKVMNHYIRLNKGQEILNNVDETYLISQYYYRKYFQEVEKYWEKELEHIDTINNLSVMLDQKVDLNKRRTVRYSKDSCINIEGKDFQRLLLLSKKLKITISTMLKFAWHKLISTYTGDAQTTVGVIVSGRNINVKGIEDSIGLYINILPITMNWDNDNTIEEQLQYIQQKVADINSYSYMNLAKLQKGEQRLFHSLINFNKISDHPNNIYSIDYDIQKIDYPLSISTTQIETRVSIELKYDEALLSEKKVEKYLQQLKLILKQFYKFTQSHNDISLLREEEHHKIIYEWNDTDKPYPHNKTIHTLFEEQVLKTPNNIAVVYEDIKLTYKELNERSNQLAHFLIKHHNIKPDSLIALLLDRSEYMIIAILAVLKAGGAYVPISPDYPDDRIKYILDDTATNILITNSIYNKRINTINNKVNTIPIEDVAFSKVLNAISSTNPIIHSLTSNNLAYVIYTSGTTGKPKGVQIEHKGISNLTMMQKKGFNLSMHKNALFYSSYIFDAHVLEIFSAILNTHTLHIISENNKYNLMKLKNYIKGKKINIALLPPAILKEIKDALNLDLLMFGDESLDKKSLDYYSKNIKEILNIFGPTEVTICSSIARYKKDAVYNDIGTPIFNSKAYVLSVNLSALPIGAIGELYIGGVDLARGYLNNPKLTEERFIPNPFQTDLEKRSNINTRLYKTGDLVRWLEDGNLEYIGRNDFQVKIRGFRIELGEIESVLTDYSDIKQVAVLAKENKETNNKYLVGYYISDNREKLNEEDVLAYLSTKLPEYMVPTAIVHIDEFPLTLNGKLDRKALPDPLLGSNDDTYTVPRNDLETKLCNIFAGVLGLDISKIGINDDFFRLGGDSMLAIKLVNKIIKETSLIINIADIFSYKNIKRLAHHLKTNIGKEIIIPISRISKLEKQSLSFAQERLFFIDKYEQGTNAYNIPIIYRLNDNTNILSLRKALDSVVKRQQVLCTSIQEDSDGNSFQYINKFHNKYCKEVSVKSIEEVDTLIAKDIKYIFSLSKEYPIKVRIYKLRNTKKKYISIIIHHIAFDGWSTDIFFNELLQYYNIIIIILII